MPEPSSAARDEGHDAIVHDLLADLGERVRGGLCEQCPHPVAEHYASGCGWCICKTTGPATDD